MFVQLYPTSSGIWKTFFMAHLLFQLWDFEKPKNKPLLIFGTKTYLKGHFSQF